MPDWSITTAVWSTSCLPDCVCLPADSSEYCGLHRPGHRCRSWQDHLLHRPDVGEFFSFTPYSLNKDHMLYTQPLHHWLCCVCAAAWCRVLQGCAPKQWRGDPVQTFRLWDQNCAHCHHPRHGMLHIQIVKSIKCTFLSSTLKSWFHPIMLLMIITTPVHAAVSLLDQCNIL